MRLVLIILLNVFMLSIVRAEITKEGKVGRKDSVIIEEFKRDTFNPNIWRVFRAVNQKKTNAKQLMRKNQEFNFLLIRRFEYQSYIQSYNLGFPLVSYEFELSSVDLDTGKDLTEYIRNVNANTRYVAAHSFNMNYVLKMREYVEELLETNILEYISWSLKYGVINDQCLKNKAVALIHDYALNHKGFMAYKVNEIFDKALPPLFLNDSECAI